MREGWRQTNLGEAVEVTMGRQRSPKHAVGEHILPYLRAANVKDGRLELDSVFEMNFSPAEQATFSLRPGDVLVTEGCGSIGQLGAAACWRGEIHGTVCFQNTLLRLRAVQGLTDPGFVDVWARHAFSSGLFAAVASGTNIFHIGSNSAKEIPFLCPPLIDQRRIIDLMAALDRYLNCLDFIVSSANSAIQPLLDEAARGSMMIPLSEVLMLARAGGTPNRKESAFFGGAIPWLKSGEVAQHSISQTEESLTRAGLESSAAWVVPVGAIVVAMYGATAGQVGRTAIPLATNQAVLALLARDDRADARFLFHWLRGRTPAMKARATGAAQPNLSKGRVLVEAVPDMPLAQQRRTADLLDSIVEAAEAAASTAQACRQLRAALLADLLTGDHAIPDSYDVLLESAS